MNLIGRKWELVETAVRGSTTSRYSLNLVPVWFSLNILLTCSLGILFPSTWEDWRLKYNWQEGHARFTTVPFKPLSGQ